MTENSAFHRAWKTRFPLLTAALLAFSCQEQGTGPVTPPRIPCEDAGKLLLPRFSVTTHKHPVKVRGKTTSIPGMTWADGDSVRAFFGGKDVKLVFTREREMYLASYTGGEAKVSLISHGDEGVNGAVGSINSPLFSPDGKKIVFAGTTRGKPGFILDAVPGETDAWRVPLDPKAHVTADPHWFVDSGKTFVYFSTLPGLVNYNPNCSQVAGSTYRVQVLGDTSVDSISITGIPGAYRGGISKDGNWAGTSYAASALYYKPGNELHLLGDNEQQCNPSMNPYPVGSTHMDYMMVLAFGGVPYHTIAGGTVLEGLHENLWIYNKDNKIVWQAKRPDDKVYLRFDKPEWSTHPDFATAVALKYEELGGDGDLYVVKIGDLADAPEGELHQAQAYLKIGSGGFTSDSYSHLWVAP
ncbi:MAG: hypothetical protein JWP91_3609 [Fibrobacteres bacterium]|nr:hypothetical protein [Fibrobacterota bacterium]